VEQPMEKAKNAKSNKKGLLICEEDIRRKD
jgi:hypothetical protein